MTNYISNGGGFTDENITLLLDRLASHTLNPIFEGYGSFVTRSRATGLTTFFGNFLTYSHVFHIVTDDPSVIVPLRKAIRENRSRDSYAMAREL